MKNVPDGAEEVYSRTERYGTVHKIYRLSVNPSRYFHWACDILGSGEPRPAQEMTPVEVAEGLRNRDEPLSTYENIFVDSPKTALFYYYFVHKTHE